MKSKKDVFSARTKKVKRKSFSYIDGHLSSQECRIGGKAPKVQRTSRAPKRHSKRWLRCIRRVHETRIVSFASDGCTSDGRYCETTWLCGTRRRRSICLHPGKKWRTFQVCYRFHSQSVPDTWIRFPRHKCPASWSGIEDPVVPLERNLFGLPPLVGETFWRDWFLEGRKNQIWNVCLFCESNDYSFRCSWMTLKFDWKKAEYGSHVKEIDETCGSRRTDIISWSRLFGIYSTWSQNEREYYWKKREMFESRISATATEKLPGWEKPHAKTVACSYDMEGHAKKYKERNCQLAKKQVSRRRNWKWISINLGAGLGHPIDPVVSVQNKNFSGHTKELAKVPGTRIGILKSLTQTIHWNLAKLVKIFPGITVRRHHTDQKQMGLLKEQCAE